MKFTLTLHYIKVEADPAIAVQIVSCEVAQIFAELFAPVCNFLIALCLNNLK